MRPLNFGFKALQEPLHPQNIIRQIRRYDAQNAARVRDLLRSIAGLDRAAKELVDVYQQIIEEQHRTSPSSVKEKTWRYRHLLFRDALRVKVFATWDLLKRGRVNSLTRLPGIDLIKRGMKRILLD